MKWRPTFIRRQWAVGSLTTGLVVVMLIVAWARPWASSPGCPRTAGTASELDLVLAVPDEATPAILEEAEALRELLPNAHVFVGEDAKADLLREYGARAGKLHIAAHGVFRSDNPMFSALRLGDSWLNLVDIFNLKLGVIEGVVLLGGLWLIMHHLMRAQREDPDGLSETITVELDELPEMTTLRGLTWLAVGLFALIVSAQVLVWAATEIAEILQVSELIIGLTILAVGTSLPELAATVTAAMASTIHST